MHCTYIPGTSSSGRFGDVVFGTRFARFHHLALMTPPPESINFMLLCISRISQGFIKKTRAAAADNAQACGI
jgi:hypothetical protein